MYQNLHSRSAHRVEGAEDVQGIGGTEPEDGFALIQHDEGLWTEGTVRSGDGCHLGALKLWPQGEEGTSLRCGHPCLGHEWKVESV